MQNGNVNVSIDYGMIGDCQSAALVSSDGTINWGSLPDLDSPAIFCRLTDVEQGGHFQIRPANSTDPGSQRYLRSSTILQTTFSTTTGKVLLTDFMPVETLDIPPQEPPVQTQVNDTARQCLVRSLECLEGTVPIVMTLKVTPNYGATACEAFLLEGDKGAIISSESQHVGLAIIGTYRISPFSIGVSQDESEQHPSVTAQMTIYEGERIQFALGIRREQQAARKLVEEEMPQRNFDWEMAHTLHCWRSWAGHHKYDGPYLDWIQRSVLTLKMLGMARSF